MSGPFDWEQTDKEMSAYLAEAGISDGITADAVDFGSPPPFNIDGVAFDKCVHPDCPHWGYYSAGVCLMHKDYETPAAALLRLTAWISDHVEGSVIRSTDDTVDTAIHLLAKAYCPHV